MRFRHLQGVDTAALDGTTADDEAADADHGATPTDVGDAVAIADAVVGVEVATG